MLIEYTSETQMTKSAKNTIIGMEMLKCDKNADGKLRCLSRTARKRRAGDSLR